MDTKLIAQFLKGATEKQIEESLNKVNGYAISVMMELMVDRIVDSKNVISDSDIEPEEFKFMQKISRLRFLHNKPFTWLPETGEKYGGKIKFVWPECSNAQLIVPEASTNYSPNGHNHATYFCGTQNKPGESNGIRASIFGPAGCHATFVELHHN